MPKWEVLEGLKLSKCVTVDDFMVFSIHEKELKMEQKLIPQWVPNSLKIEPWVLQG